MADHERVVLGDEVAEPGSHHSRRQLMMAAALAGAGMTIGGPWAFGAQAKADPNKLIHETGFSEEEANIITATGKKLTVEDLHEMRNAGFTAVLDQGKTVKEFLADYKTKGGMAVTAEDITSIHKANNARHERLYHGKQVSVSCCCCSPCCTCASVVTNPVVDRRV
jgi:hypothetical protein